MYVIGTAGHVDHGKSTLTYALSGINPDRLEEEQRREMTIDLGFAWLDLPNGERVGMVDVPGHRDFIENMLAGVGGIDAVILVIAADEGVMPQTREHLAIIDLLAVPTGLIALTKMDLISDADWVELVQLDILEAVQGTRLEGQPIIPVSAQTGEGLDTLVNMLGDVLAGLPPRPNRDIPRLPIDRVFTISGFGVVVTGTLLDGSLAVGQEVEIQPSNVRARIRGLQSYEESVERVGPGQRTAVNLRGVEKDSIARGDVLGPPGTWHPTTLLDAWLRYLPQAQHPLEHNDAVKFFVGTSEIMGRVRVLDRECVLPGEQSWIQIRLESPVAATQGDRYIIRRPSPPETIGGGVIVDTAPGKRWKRFRPEVIERLQVLLTGDPLDLALLKLSRSPGPVRAETIGLDAQQLELAAETGQLMAWGDSDWIIHRASWEHFVDRTRRILAQYHARAPLRQGMPRDALRSRLQIQPVPFDVMQVWLIDMGIMVAEAGDMLRLPEHEVRLSAAQEEAVRSLWKAFEQSPHTPPTYSQARELIGEEILEGLIEQGDLIRISTEVIFAPDIVSQWVTFARTHLEQGAPLTVAVLRDHFQTSRRYALDFLERLDALGITRRRNDDHVRGSGRWEQLI